MRLLISVTAAAGAEIIDVKDPATGSLGRAHPGDVREIRAVTPPHLPVSAALGDGPFETREATRTALLLSECGARYVKIGLRDTSTDEALVTLRTIRAGLPRRWA